MSNQHNLISTHGVIELIKLVKKQRIEVVIDESAWIVIGTERNFRLLFEQFLFAPSYQHSRANI